MRRVIRNGYWTVKVPEHPGCEKHGSYKGWEYEHRYLMEVAIGRVLSSDEVVHHVNGDRLDNRLENLAVMTRTEHTLLHAGVDAMSRCERCGKPISKRARLCNDCARESESVMPRTDDISTAVSIATDVMEHGYNAVARKFGISDNGLRKWLKRHGFHPCGRRRFASPLPDAI